MKKVLVLGREDKRYSDIFAAHGIECAFSNAVPTDEEKIAADGAGYEAMLFTATRFTASLFDKLPDLKMISRSGIGIDTVDMEAAAKHGVIVCNSANYGTYDVAQHTVALIMSLLHSVPRYDHRVKERYDWSSSGIPYAHRLSTCKLGIVGFGRISKWICKMMSGFGMEIFVYDPYISKESAAELGVKAVNMNELISEADIISVNAPLTPETHHMIDEAAIARMKDSVLIVNTSRGPLIDTEALIAGLKSGKVAGAALDVFEEEPFAEDCELRRLPNVVLTPHVAWRSEEAIHDLLYEVTGNIIDYFEGRPLRNALNMKK